MRIRPPARIAAFACLGIALGMAALALRETPPEPAPRQVTVHGDEEPDPLQARLRACREAGQAAASDPECLAAWEENRRRFLGQRREPALDDQPGKSTEPVPIAPEEPGATSQEQ